MVICRIHLRLRRIERDARPQPGDDERRVVQDLLARIHRQRRLDVAVGQHSQGRGRNAFADHRHARRARFVLAVGEPAAGDR